MKKIIKVLLSAFMFISTLSVNLSNAKAMEPEWIRTIDSEGNIVETLNMSDEEIEAMQIANLKQKYEKSRMDEYVYNYESLGQVYDTGAGVTTYILVGSNLGWAQRSQFSFDSTITFSVSAVYKAITGQTSISMRVGETISFDSSMDSKLGTFARIKTNKYRETVTEKYSGNVVSSYIENSALVSDRTYRPIYRNSSNNIVFKYGGSTYQAKILRPTLKTPPTSSSDIVNATNSNF